MASADELRELIRRKDSMEEEMKGIIEALGAENMGGVTSRLVDAEGFPRADIDVHTTLALRNRLHHLNTDHRELMGQIERGLHAVHSTARSAPAPAVQPPAPPLAPSNSVSTPSASCSVATNGHSESPVCFALVNAVTSGGPASEAGLQGGDRLLRYGTIHAGNHDGLRALGRLTSRSEGSTIPILVERGGAQVHVTLTPRRWQGAGLLGCHIVPL